MFNETANVFIALKFTSYKEAQWKTEKVWNVYFTFHIVCKDAEAMGGEEARLDDSEREQSRGTKGQAESQRETKTTQREGQRRTKGRKKIAPFFSPLYIDLTLNVHLLPARHTCFENQRRRPWRLKSEEAVGHKQSNVQKTRSGWGQRAGERTEGGARKQQMSEGNEEGGRENKRGHRRPIKDTQLNGWTDAPLDLSGHLHPSPPPLQPRGRRRKKSQLLVLGVHQPPISHCSTQAANQRYRYKSMRNSALCRFFLLVPQTHSIAQWEKERREKGRKRATHWLR